MKWKLCYRNPFKSVISDVSQGMGEGESNVQQ